MKVYKNPGKLEFDAIIKTNGQGGEFVDFPYDPMETFGAKNLIPVIMTFDEAVYRGSLANMGGGLMCLLRKDIREQIGKGAGDQVYVTITLDDQPRQVEIPPELASALADNPTAKAIFDNFAFTHKREFVRWINEAKRPETRDARVKKSLEMILAKQTR